MPGPRALCGTFDAVRVRSLALDARTKPAAFALGCAASLVACGGAGSAPATPERLLEPAADIAELEIRADWSDRFVACPPPGELGQNWVPKPFPWTPPPATEQKPVVVDEDLISRSEGRTPTEQASLATHREFRQCFRQSLVHDPTQDGHVAIVLRVGADGRVAKVEEYGACEISPEALGCMRHAAGRLRFMPPAGGSDTIVLPSVFTSRDGVSRASPSSNDSYTAGAYVTLESARPGLHACEESARKFGTGLQATGTFTMDIDAQGRVTSAHVDPWSGEQSVLACAAAELQKLTFEAPPKGKGIVIARLNFNPRQGSR